MKAAQIILVIFCCFYHKSFGVSTKTRPNILLILTDDQDVVLNSLVPMKQVQNLLIRKGVTFSNAFTSSPICCPSRSSILSGLYSHNTNTINNSLSGGCCGDYWKKHIEPKALPVIFEKNGYETFYAGKYLNTYESTKVPPGWNRFYGLHGNSKYYNYKLNENGIVKTYKDLYLTDVLNTKIVGYLENRTIENKKPFLAVVAPPSPHQPFTPATRHAGLLNGTKAIRTPNFNLLSGNLDKHWLVSSGKKIHDSLLSELDIIFQKRWESLLAVDDLVHNIVTTLEKTKELENTYIVYTSDNGYHIGQFAQPYDKRQPYETDIRIPFIVRGPKVPEKFISSFPIVLLDIFPTFLDWAGIKSPINEDGISFDAYLMNPKYDPIHDKSFHRQILIQHWGEGSVETYNPECPWKKNDRLAECNVETECHCQDSWNNTYSCVRHVAFNTDKLYCEFQDYENLVEAYDLQVDPFQIINVGYDLLPSELAMYNLALKNLSTCIGENCRNTKF